MSYNPAAGPPQVALFTFNHISGSASTGAIGFTPKYCIYVGACSIDTSGNGNNSAAFGVATGTAGNQRGAGFGYAQGPGSPQDPGGTSASDNASIFGFAQGIQNNSQISGGFLRELKVTAFGAGGITLTWSVAVSQHQGNLLVVG